jgi:hypothetical protein
MSILPNMDRQSIGGQEEHDEPTDTATTIQLPPYEPLILWMESEVAPADSATDAAPYIRHKVEVVPELACKLRPHQREGVQFLFDCTMGIRGYSGQVRNWCFLYLMCVTIIHCHCVGMYISR